MNKKNIDIQNESYAPLQAHSLQIKFISMTTNKFFSNEFHKRDSSYHTFMFIKSGKASISVNGSLFSVSKNDVLLIPSGSDTILISKNDTFSTHCCNFNAELDGRSVFANFTPTYHYSGVDMPQAKNGFAAIEKYLRAENVINILKAESCITDMMIAFLESEPRSFRTDEDEFSARVRKYIDDRLATKIRVKQMAEDMEYHPKYFISLFKKNMGDTPAHYIKSARIDRAKFLLSNTNISISEIAKLVGFSTQPKFANDFRQFVGCTASEYRDSERRKFDELL